MAIYQLQLRKLGQYIGTNLDIQTYMAKGKEEAGEYSKWKTLT